MISKQDEAILEIALTNGRIASEIVSRVISASVNPAAAQALLDIISDSAKERKEIEEYMIVAMANRPYAKEIVEQLNLVIECLEYQALDKIANNVALNAAQAKINPLSASAKEILVIALANRPAAARIAAEIDASGQVAAGIIDSIVVWSLGE